MLLVAVSNPKTNYLSRNSRVAEYLRVHNPPLRERHDGNFVVERYISGVPHILEKGTEKYEVCLAYQNSRHMQWPVSSSEALPSKYSTVLQNTTTNWVPGFQIQWETSYLSHNCLSNKLYQNVALAVLEFSIYSWMSRTDWWSGDPPESASWVLDCE